MKELYSVDVKIYGTAYIRANSEEEALQKAKTNFDQVGITFGDARQEISEFADNPIIMTGERYSEDLPEISLSPVMTIHGPDKDATAEFQGEI